MKYSFKKITAILFVTLSFNACKPTGESTAEPTSESPELNTKAEGEVIGNDDLQEKPAPYCRLVLSFFSIGEGTDFQAKERMDKYLDEWYAETDQVIKPESYPWGREGEVDYCFRLNDLSEEKQASFVKGMKEALQGTDLVHINENSTYQQGR